LIRGTTVHRFGPMSDSSAPKTAPKVKDPNPLLELVLCILVPTLLLTKGSETITEMVGDKDLGPKVAIAIALSLPIGYGIWDFLKRRTFNVFAILGIVGVLATGLIALGERPPEWFAAKEALMPLLFAAGILFSHLGSTPLIRSMFFNPQLFAVKHIEKAAEERGTTGDLNKLLFKGSLGLSAVLLFSAVANWFIAMHFVGGTEPGSDAYNEGIGKTMGYGFLVLTVPLLGGMLLVFFGLMKGLRSVTGLDSTELTEGKSAKRKYVADSEDKAES